MFFGSALIVDRWEVVGWERKFYLGPAKLAAFSNRDFSRSNKYDTFWHVASTGYFYVLFSWAIAVPDFCPLEIYKNHPLSTTTFTINSHADNHFYEYIICFKHYTVWYNICYYFWPRFFIFKSDLNVEHLSYFF